MGLGIIQFGSKAQKLLQQFVFMLHPIGNPGEILTLNKLEEQMLVFQQENVLKWLPGDVSGCQISIVLLF